MVEKTRIEAATSLAYQGGTFGPRGKRNRQPTVSGPLSCDDNTFRGAEGKTTGKDNQLCDGMRIDTWNVRTLLQAASLELLSREMERCNVQLLGISETRWKGGKGHFTMSDGHSEVRVVIFLCYLKGESFSVDCKNGGHWVTIPKK